MKETLSKYTVLILRILLGIFFWVFIPIKVFIYDIDVWIVHRFVPQRAWILDARIIFYIIFFMTLWLIFSPKLLFKTILYVIFLPVSVIGRGTYRFIKRNKLIFSTLILGNIIGIVAYLGHVLVSFRKIIKTRVYLLAIYMISVSLIIISENVYVLYISTILIALYLLLHYLMKLYIVLVSTNLFTVFNRFLDNSGAEIFRVKEDIEDKDKEEKINFLVFGYFSIKYLKSKLKEFVTSPKLVLIYLLSLIFTIFITTFSLSFIHYALYKIDSNFYTTTYEPSYVDFWFLSLNTFINMDSYVIVPVSRLSGIVTSFGGFVGWIITIIYLTLLFSVLLKRYNYTVNEFIKRLDDQSNTILDELNEKFGMDWDNARTHFIAKNPNLIPAISKIEEIINEGDT